MMKVNFCFLYGIHPEKVFLSPEYPHTNTNLGEAAAGRLGQYFRAY